MDPDTTRHLVAFEGSRLLTTGAAGDIALDVKRALEDPRREPVLLFDIETSEQIDLALDGSEAEVAARYAPAEPPATRTRGRPRLGVVAREITLLPRHWEWLNAQPGGASVALRRLVDEARRRNDGRDRQRVARESVYRFIAAMAGNRPGFEEAARALFAGEAERFDAIVDEWPADVRDHTRRLAARIPGDEDVTPPSGSAAPRPES